MAVNLSPVGGVAAQFFDNAGNVLTGGKLFTYAAGTTTPQVTYTTSAGNVPWSNPIILDAAGRVSGSGEVWLNDATQYKFILRDSNDVLIATYDNITGINSNFVSFTSENETQTATQGQTVFTLTTMQYLPATNNLLVFVNGSKQISGTNYAETSNTVVTFVSGLNAGDEVEFSTAVPIAVNVVDAENVSYNPPFVGGVVTNVEDKLAQTVSVKDFGAVGDGITDDTAAIQAAHDSSAYAVYYPATQNGYLISSTITISNSAQTAFGDGMYSSFLRLAAQNFDVFNITAVGNVQIRDLGAINYGTATSGFFVNATIPYGVQILNCYTNNIHSGVLCGTAGSSLGGARTIIEGCRFIDIAKLSGYGVIKSGTSEIFDVINCEIGRLGSTVAADNAAAGILLQGGTAINLENLQITGAGTPVLVQPNADNVSHIVLNCVWCDSSSGNGMFIDGSSGIVTDLRAVESWFCSCGVDGIRIIGVARDIKINGNNQITRNNDSGVNVGAGATVFGLNISNNSIGGNLSNGITIGGGANGFAIQNNQIGSGSVFGANANGIVLSAGSTNNYILTANDLRGNTGSALVNFAAGTTARVESNLGYNPIGVFGVTVGASPFTHTAGASPETVFINSGTVSLVKVSGVSIFQQTNCSVQLAPFQSLEITYSVAPGVVRSIS